MTRPPTRPRRCPPLAGQPAFVVVALGASRTGDRHSAAAIAELSQLGAALTSLVAAAPGALIAITSRGATAIDDPAADFYGPGSSRHVPFDPDRPGRPARHRDRRTGHAGRYSGHFAGRPGRTQPDGRGAGHLGHRAGGRRDPPAVPGCRDAGTRALARLSFLRGLNTPMAEPARAPQPRPADTPTLDFERPVVDLERKIEELIRVSGGASELRPQIALLESRARELQQKIFAELTPVAEGAAVAPPCPPVHAGLHRTAVRRLRRAARRPPLRRRPRHRRRVRAVRRQADADPGSPEGAQHEGEGPAQLRPAQAGGLPQGAAPDGAGGARRAAHRLPRSTPRAPTPASTPRSAGRPRRSPRTWRSWPACRSRSSARSSARGARAARWRWASRIGS